MPSLNNLGEYYRILGKYEKAEKSYIESIEIYKKAVGEEHIDYANVSHQSKVE